MKARDRLRIAVQKSGRHQPPPLAGANRGPELGAEGKQRLHVEIEANRRSFKIDLMATMAVSFRQLMNARSLFIVFDSGRQHSAQSSQALAG